MKKRSNLLVNDKKGRGRIFLIGIILISIIRMVVIVSAISDDERISLQNELNLLEQNLTDSGYNWLINQSLYLNISDNLMLSNDNKILAL